MNNANQKFLKKASINQRENQSLGFPSAIAFSLSSVDDMRTAAFILVFMLFVLLSSVPADAKRKKKRIVSSSSDTQSGGLEIEQMSSNAGLEAKLKEMNAKKKLDDEELSEEELAKRQAVLESEEKELRKNLFRTRRNYGPESKEMAAALHKLGKNVYHQGRYDEANEFAVEVVRIHEKIDGPDEIATAMALCNLGSVSFRTQRLKICELAMFRAVAILIKKYGKESPEVLLHRGKMLTFKLPYGDIHEGISFDEFKEEMAEAEEELREKRDGDLKDDSDDEF